jgi:CubicO group peptidase (beta-lactamase class C family)
MTKYAPNNLWSTSKCFLSALIGIALRENYLTNLDQRMMDFFPEYITPDLDPRKYDITIRHLLTMRSGIPGEFDEVPGFHSIWDQFLNSENWIKFAIEIPLVADPGGAMHYSTPSTHILSGIITKATGISTSNFAMKYLFDPLNILDVGWDIDPQGYNRGGWGMYLTSRDMARFGYLYLNNGLVDGKQIVPAKWIEESLTVYSYGDAISYGVVTNWGYGYQWDIGRLADYHVYYRLGAGGQLIFNIPELNMIIVTTASVHPDRSVRYTRIASIYRLISYYILSPVRNWLGPPPYSPSGLSVMTVENRSLTQVESLNVLKWQPSPRNEGVNISKYRIYQVQTGEERVLLGEVDANRLEYWHRIRRFNEEYDYTYGVSSVTGDNKESVTAIVTVR